jgi:hypothetical protein
LGFEGFDFSFSDVRMQRETQIINNNEKKWIWIWEEWGERVLFVECLCCVVLCCQLWCYLVATSSKPMWGWHQLFTHSYPLIYLSHMGPIFLYFCLFTYCCPP